MTALSLWKKASLVVVLVLALYMISNSDDTNNSSSSVFTALQRHEPSLRIFRSLFQVNLCLWCAAFSLYVWSKTIGTAMIAELFFQPVVSATTVTTGSNNCYPEESYHSVGVVQSAQQQRQQQDEQEGLVGKDNNEQEQDDTSENYNEDDYLDQDEDWEESNAHYESDGEVEEPAKMQPLPVPLPASVASAAADMLLLLLVTLFLFTLSSSLPDSSESDNDVWSIFSRVAAPTFPLLLFCYLACKAVLPWRKRGTFWTVICMTPAAPWCPVTFRDGFIGDILTSSVRPMQDICFTIGYLLFGLRGWWSQSYNTDSFFDQADARVPAMERSWILHTVILPMCMVSPLWWRFLQNLRQTYEAQQRWPYLGNALKYFLAAQVAMVGLFYPDQKQGFAWLASFVIATLYQIWWDVFLDWELLVRINGRWQLRPNRLYSKTWVYWTIALVNVVLRFCWTLSFLPPRYLNAAGVLTETFGDLTHVLGATIASAEIIRRTLWGLLRFEWEVVKESNGDRTFRSEDSAIGEEYERGLELTPMKMASDGPVPSNIIPRVSLSNDMSSMNEIQVLAELCVYAGVFCLFGMVVAAHRGTA